MATTFRHERITEIRTSLRLTQGEFAEKLGVSRQMVNEYEQGHTVPGTTILMRLVTVTGVKLDSLFADDTDGQSVSAKATR